MIKLINTGFNLALITGYVLNRYYILITFIQQERIYLYTKVSHISCNSSLAYRLLPNTYPRVVMQSVIDFFFKSSLFKDFIDMNTLR